MILKQITSKLNMFSFFVSVDRSVKHQSSTILGAAQTLADTAVAAAIGH